MQNSIIILLPSVILLAVAVYTKNVIKSLLTGIIAAAFIVKNFAPVESINLVARRLFEQTEISNLIYKTGSYDNLYTFAFLIILGIIICMITHTGGMAAYTKAIKTRLHGPKATQTVSLILSNFFFMDDYLNTLTVGSVMKPLTDAFRIPRAKLAFLLDSMSSALCTLIPASSWTAIVLSQLQGVGIQDTLGTYLTAMPFIFYSWLIIFTAWFVVRAGISFGKMRDFEDIALETGNLFGGKEPIQDLTENINNQQKSSLTDFFLPIGLFMFSVFLSFAYTGSWAFLGGQNNLVTALQKGDALYSLFIASLITLIISVIYFGLNKKLSFKEFTDMSINGFYLMKNSIILLLLAKTMSMLLKSDLNTGAYLAGLMVGSVPAWLFPAIIFVTSSLVAMATGSSWGTISVMIPLGIPMVGSFDAILLSPTLGAILSGSIAGAHLSPISDPMLISSTSSGSYHLDHIQTQIVYAAPAMLGTILALLLTGFILTQNTIITGLIALLTGVIFTGSVLYFLNKKRS